MVVARPKPPRRRFRHGDDCPAHAATPTLAYSHDPGGHRLPTHQAHRKTARQGEQDRAAPSAIAALNAGDPEEYLALFAPDAACTASRPASRTSRASCRFHAATAETFPDATVTLDDADRRARPRRDALHVARDARAPGSSLVARGGAIVRFADGQIAECWNLPAELHAVAA